MAVVIINKKVILPQQFHTKYISQYREILLVELKCLLNVLR